MNGGKPARGAHAGNRARDGMRGADRDSEMSRGDQGQSRAGFRGEPAEWLQLCYFLPHGFHYAPSSRHRAARDGQVAAQDNPQRHEILGLRAAGNQRGGDDSHALLSVAGSVAETEPGRRNHLQATEPSIHAARSLSADHPTGHDGDDKSRQQSDARRHKYENYRQYPAMNHNCPKPNRRDRRSSVSAHQGMRRTRGQAPAGSWRSSK